MSTEPFKPYPHVQDNRPAAADPGQGAPPPAEGYGREVEDTDVVEPAEDEPSE